MYMQIPQNMNIIEKSRIKMSLVLIPKRSVFTIRADTIPMSPPMIRDSMDLVRDSLFRSS